MANLKDTWGKLMNSIRAFREAWMSSDLILDQTRFGDVDARQLRYTLYWALYENSAYRSLHKWAHAYKVNYGLYRHVRAIYNPAYRLGEFWKTHLWGGRLDYEAKDDRKTALPIVTENEALRTAIGQLWRWSNWQVNKDIATLWGSVLGDVAIKIVDDPTRKKVYLKNIHPGSITAIELDPFGNVKGYIIEELRPDPQNADRQVTYREVCSRDGDNVVYQTYLNEDPYDWEGNGVSEWSEPYGFVPMVMIQHNNVGLSWGWSEFHAAHEKFREVDDLASKLSDQIRKMVDAAWLFSGINKPSKDKPTTSPTTPTDSYPQSDREELPALYGPPGSSATPLIAPLDIAATSNYIASILKILEQDYPELSADIHNVQGDISGRALRVNQQPAKSKVGERRPNYDDALVRVQQMAVAIGGFRKYPAFEGFDLTSYEKGDLDHTIGERPVFAEDPLDELEYETSFWTVSQAAKNNGIPLTLFLEEHGWTSERIAKLTSSPEYQARVATLNQVAMLGGSGRTEKTEPGRGRPDVQNADQDQQGQSGQGGATANVRELRQ